MKRLQQIWQEFDLLDHYLLAANILIFAGVTALRSVWHAMIALGSIMLLFAAYAIVTRKT